jgi:hypothetical protein
MTSYTPPRTDIYRHENDQHQPFQIDHGPGPGPQQAQPETAAQLSFNTCVGLNDVHAELKAAKDAEALEEYRANRITEKGFAERRRASAFGDDGEPERLLGMIEQTDAQCVEAARSRYTAAVDALSAPGDTSEELRRTRFAIRVNREIDAAQNGALKTALAQRLIKDAKTDGEVAVLLEELPTKLDNTNWLPDYLKQVRPEIGNRAAELANAERLSMVTRYTVGAVRRGIKRGQPVPKAVFDRLAPAVARFDPDAKQAVT